MAGGDAWFTPVADGQAERQQGCISQEEESMRVLVSASVAFAASLLIAPSTLSQSPAVSPESADPTARVSASPEVPGSGPRAAAVDAPTGFDLVSNGFAEEFCANQAQLTDSPNSPLIPGDECSFDTSRVEFTGPEGVTDGLGMVFNAAGCGECHLTPILGGSSQVTESGARPLPERRLHRASGRVVDPGSRGRSRVSGARRYRRPRTS